MKTKELYSKKEAAEYLGASVRTVERMIASGAISKIKLRGLVRIRRSELVNLVESGCR